MIHNLQLEQNLISSVFFLKGYGEAVDEVMATIKPADFYDVQHKHMFSAMLDLYRKDIAPDSGAVVAHRFCEDQNLYDYRYVLNLFHEATSGINIRKYAESLKKIAVLRQTQERVNSINEIIASSGDLDDKLKEIEELFSVDVGFTSQDVGAKHVRDCMPTYIDRLSKRWENPDSILFRSGIQDLDNILGGGFEIGLYAIGANPKMGKTELMGKIVSHFAIDRELPVYVGSLEMPDFQVIERLVSSVGKIDKRDLKDNFPMLSGKEFEVAHSIHKKACSDVGFADIYIDDRHENSVKRIRRECLKIKKKHGRVGGIFVDYLTLLSADGKHDRNDLAVASMTRALKGMSKEFLCPVIMLLQLNRGNTSRTDKRPLASDSRDSGAIEQDCDGWIGLYRDSVYDAESPWGNITEIIVRLNRHGETGTCYQLLTPHGFKDVSEEEVAMIKHKAEKGVNKAKDPTYMTTADM